MKTQKNKRLTNGLTVLYILLTLGMGTAIFANIISIQWVHGDEWDKRRAERENKVEDEPARRGDILSSDGKVLVTTLTKCDLYLDLANYPELDKKGAQKFSQKTGEPLFKGPIQDSDFYKYLDTVCLMLNRAFPNHSVEYYHEKISSERKKDAPSRFFKVQTGVPYSVWNDIRKVPGWGRGVATRNGDKPVMRQVREPIYDDMAHNVLGFANALEKGTYTGLEGYYDSILRGVDGKYYCHRLTKSMWSEEDPARKGMVTRQKGGGSEEEVIYDTIMLSRRQDGKSIVSTIDTRYQDIAESSLRNLMRKYGGKAGCAILMEVKTGYVLACANLAVDTTAHDYREVRDRNVAVENRYEPGSTFKTVVLTAMLNDPAIKLDTAMRVRASKKDFGGKGALITDSHDHHDEVTGKVVDTFNIREVIERSSNVGMAELGWMYYHNRRDTLVTLVKEVFPYDFLNPDLECDEARSTINDLKQSKRDLLVYCFGHTTAVSPLRVLTFYNALAADGRMVKPLFCRAIVDNHGNRTEMPPVVLREHAFSRESARMVRDMLVGVVNHKGGTGYRDYLRTDKYTIAGKTGTAEVKGKGVNNSTFVGFFPAEEPRYSCLVFVENTPLGGVGMGMVFRDIADCVMAIDKKLGVDKFTRTELQDDSAMAATRPYLARGDQQELMELYRKLKLPYLSTDSSSHWVRFRTANDSMDARYVPYAPAEGTVPNCVGMTAKDAVAILHEAGYRVKVQGYGKVRSQSPRAGQALKAGNTVEVILK